MDSFDITGTDLAKIYASLQAVDSKTVRAKVDDIGIEPVVAVLKAQYHERSYEVFPDHHTFLAAWLVASVGPRLRHTSDFELPLKSSGIVAPRWVLGLPIRGAHHRRCPARPLIWPSDWERDDLQGSLRLAYLGLLEHLEDADAAQRLNELSTSAIQWRLVALVDGLAPESRSPSQSIAARLQSVLSGTRLQTTSAIEQDWLRAIDVSLSWRRNALTHLFCEPGDGGLPWTFRRCVEPALLMSDLLPMCAGLSLAVMDSVADALRNEPDSYVRALAERCQNDAY